MNCTLKNGENGKFYVISILSQPFKKSFGSQTDLDSNSSPVFYRLCGHVMLLNISLCFVSENGHIKA